MNLVLQPCSNKVAQQHYQDTIDNKNLKLNDIKNKLGNQDYTKFFNEMSDVVINFCKTNNELVRIKKVQ